MILVTGATGYVGTHLVYALRARGEAVRCLVRPETSDEQLVWFRQWNAEVIEGELTDLRCLESALDGVDKVVHLVGSVQKPSNETMYRMHVEKTNCLLQAMRGRPIKRFVLLSSLGARPDARTDYHRTKWQAEEAVRQSGSPFVILCPSLIFGKLVGDRESKLIARLTRGILGGKQIPIIEKNGGSLVQPIFIGDLIHCLEICLDRDDLVGRRFELGGSERMSFEALVDNLAAYHQLSARKIRLPAGLMIALARLLGLLSKSPPLSVDQVRLLCQDNICEIAEMRNVFQLEPLGLRLGLSVKPQIAAHIPYQSAPNRSGQG